MASPAVRRARARRFGVSTRHELRDQIRRDLVVGRVAERLELGVCLLDADGDRADLLDLPLIVAYVVAALELVGEEVVVGVVEVGSGEIPLEETRRGGGPGPGPAETAVGGDARGAVCGGR